MRLRKFLTYSFITETLFFIKACEDRYSLNFFLFLCVTPVYWLTSSSFCFHIPLFFTVQNARTTAANQHGGTHNFSSDTEQSKVSGPKMQTWIVADIK